MAVYVSLALWLGLCALLGNRCRNIIWLNILLLSLVNGLRDVSIGVDTSNYYDIWNWISQGAGDYIEPGWYFLNRIIQSLGGGYNLLLWIAALITFFPIGWIGRRCVHNPSLVLLFYYLITFYLQSFNMMRQDLAISLVFLGYMNLFSGNKKRYFFWIALSCLFHYTAFVALFVLLLPKNLISSQMKVVTLLLSSFMGSFLLTPDFLSMLIGPYAVYLQDGQGIRDSVLTAYVLGALVNILYVIIYKTIKPGYRNTWFMKVYFAGIVVMNLTTQLELGTRIVLYFTILQVIVFPVYMQYNCFKNKSVAVVLALTYAIVLFFKYLIGDPLQICPYKFYFV